MTSQPHDPQSLGEELERLFEQTPAPDPLAKAPTAAPEIVADEAAAAALERPAPTVPVERVAMAMELAIDNAVRAAVEAAVERSIVPLVADLREQLANDDQRDDRVQQDMDLLRSQLDAAFDHLETMVGEVAASVRRLADRPAAEPVAAVDLHPLVDQVQRLHEDVAAQVADSRKALRSDLTRLAERLGEGTVEVDTRRLEEVVHRGAIANAADIANLSGELEALIAAIKAHDTNLSDLRKQIEWIKQRVLSR
ncbi:MAG: hypothetical protein ACSLFP_10165 [Acidimicrobiales bacterium]